MKTLKFLLEKEFRQIFRDKALLPLLFFAPMMQLLILPLAADYEIKNINIAIVDQDRSSYSKELITTLEASNYFQLTDVPVSFAEAFELIENNQADLILEIPPNFEKELVRENRSEFLIGVNAINGVKANLGSVYLSQIITDFNANIRMDWAPNPRFNNLPNIDVAGINWFNPALSYKYHMVPGILALLVTMIGAYMCALNIVKENEVGTMEQINVTPIKKHHFILGKLIPFWILGMMIFTFGLFGIGWLIYGIVPQGNLLLLYVYLAIYLVAVLGLGLLISTYSNTQQQAMSIAFFFMMIFALMSGLFTPIENMPDWAFAITQISPTTFFIEVMRMVVLKGSGFEQIQYHFLMMIVFAVIIKAWAIMNYKKTK